MSSEAFFAENSPSGFLPLLSAVGVGAAMGVGAAIYYASGGGCPHEPVMDLKNQTVELSGTDGARVSQLAAGKELTEYMYEDAKTAYEGFRRGARVSGNGACLGYRIKRHDGVGPYVWISYNDVIQRAENLACGFVASGVQPGQDTKIGIFSLNRPEWVIAEQACYAQNMITVPLYDTLGPDACSFIVNQAEIPLVVCDSEKRAEKLVEKAESCPTLKTLVMMEKPNDEFIQRAKSKGIQIVSMSEAEALGRGQKSEHPLQIPSPDDLATICYTSGTTGLPKGAMLTHKNLMAVTSCCQHVKYMAVGSEDIVISYLPLAHMFERAIETVAFQFGGRVGYYQGDVKLLTEDIKELKPTIMPVVPRLLCRVYDKVMQDVSKSAIKKCLFDWALKSKSQEVKRGIFRNTSIWDKVVFKKIREGMGGRLRILITGAAPLSEHVLTFIRCALGCAVLEGYGQTECAAIATSTIEGDHVAEQVGPPVSCCMIKLVDVPSMNYHAKDGRGEVCIKGHNVFKGYFNDPEKTAEALDSDGWLRTGDIGEWTPHGTVKLIDRIKHIFKLAQGEYIAPEKIENVYTTSKFVAQVFVHGDSLKSSLVAVVVPDEYVLMKHCSRNGIQGTFQEICLNKDVKQLILDDMVARGKSEGLFSFEQAKDVYLDCELWSIDNGLLTPTLKSKRQELLKKYRDAINDMYKALI